jgi:hypothetical protein
LAAGFEGAELDELGLPESSGLVLSDELGLGSLASSSGVSELEQAAPETPSRQRIRVKAE